MSNPSVNRWGLNTFWHNFWYTDFQYSYNVQQDHIFTKLIHLFLFYGVNLTYNIFASSYWYAKQYSHLTINSYQRWIHRKPNQFGEILKYSLRVEADSIFLMKIWILRYGKWVVINQYWFQPLKKRAFKVITEDPDHVDSVNLIKQSKKFNLRKIKTLLSRTLIQKLTTNQYYRF